MSTRRSVVRLGAVLLAPLVAATLCQAIYNLRAHRELATHDLEQRAQSLAHMLVEVDGPSLALDDPSAVDDGLGHVTADPDVTFALALDAAGRPVAYRGAPGDRARWVTEVAGRDGVSTAGDTELAVYPVETNGHRIGTIAIGLGLARMEDEVSSVTIRAAAISAAGILVAVLAVLVLGRRLSARNREMARLLANVDQGFFAIDAAGVMAEERSALATRLLGPPVRGERLADALRRLDGEVGLWFELGWDAVREGVMPVELCLEQLPKRVAHGGRTYRIDYKPVTAGGDTLVVFSDITDELAHARLSEEEHDFVSAIERITRDRRGFTELVADADTSIRRLSAGTLEPAAAARALHTLKGNFGLFGLSALAQTCHAIEDGRVQVAELERAWRHLRDKLDVVFGRSLTERGLDVTAQDIAELRVALAQPSAPADLAAIIDGWELERVETRLQRAAERARGLARQLGKGDIDVAVSAAGVRVDSELLAPFWSAFAHVVRNAVDHGLETPEERVAAGKPAAGSIAIVARASTNSFDIELCDDGRGVDWAAVATRARRLGLAAETHSDLVAAMFSDGVSTRDEVSETSGRGVGLAAIREACERLGGTIDVDTEPGRGTRFSFRFRRMAPVRASTQRLAVVRTRSPSLPA